MIKLIRLSDVLLHASEKTYTNAYTQTPPGKPPTGTFWLGDLGGMLVECEVETDFRHSGNLSCEFYRVSPSLLSSSPLQRILMTILDLRLIDKIVCIMISSFK